MKVREIVLKTLVRISDEQAFSNLEINNILNKYDLNSKDRSLLTVLVYGTLQHLYTLDYVIKKFIKKGFSRIKPEVLWILRLAVFQILFLDKVPSYAVINEAVNQTKKKYSYSVKFVNGILRNIQRKKDSILNEINNSDNLSIKYSLPEWIVEKYKETYPNNYREILEKLNEIPELIVRVNPENYNQVFKRLQEQGAKPKSVSDLKDNAIIIQNAKAFDEGLKNLDLFQEGLITVQDKGAIKIGEKLNPTSEDIVLDLCAAPGGKTTHLAELMHNKGYILANDLHESRVNLIKENAKRLNLKNIDVMNSDAREFNPDLVNRFDKILVDAPCSGLGIIRRKPEIRYNTKEDDLKELSEIQYDILENAFRYLKPHGQLVYSTCSITKQENEDIISKFKNNHPDEVKVIDETQTSFLDDSDCFYFALIEKE